MGHFGEKDGFLVFIPVGGADTACQGLRARHQAVRGTSTTRDHGSLPLHLTPEGTGRAVPGPVQGSPSKAPGFFTEPVMLSLPHQVPPSLPSS